MGVPLPVAVTVIIALVVWKPVWVTNAIPLPICDAEVVRDGVVDADWVTEAVPLHFMLFVCMRDAETLAVCVIDASGTLTKSRTACRWSFASGSLSQRASASPTS